MKPVIGITPSPTLDKIGPGEVRRYAMAATYTEGVEAADGIPLVIPPQANNVEAILDRLDGLLLSGGGDIDPAHYGDRYHHDNTYGIDELRDRFELDLFAAALARDMPILCICRGIQVANVALGGTLIQDIAGEFSDQIEHRQHVAGYTAPDKSHRVTVEPDSRLHDVFGAEEIETNSFHHQALRDVADELVVVGRAADGTIEAVDRPASTWFLGLQWHPEMMFKVHPEHLKPFQGLVAASIARIRPEPVNAD
ncbi:MAG: gamma-glutamyl-gamma-aminobutyrate hydrolase family protein [Thermomicrobiaceae bacterium]